MPPSGYTTGQAGSVIAFLSSCAAALEQEARSLGRTPIAALRREIANIQSALGDDINTSVSRDVLQLTATFYSSILDMAPSDFKTYSICTMDALKQVEAGILSIHVVDD